MSQKGGSAHDQRTSDLVQKRTTTVRPRDLWSNFTHMGVESICAGVYCGQHQLEAAEGIGEEMSEGIEIERGVRQGCPLSSTLFNIYLEDLVKQCFQDMGGVKVGGKRIKFIRSADDMEEEEEEEEKKKNKKQKKKQKKKKTSKLKKKHLLRTSGKRTEEETSEALCAECSIVWAETWTTRRNEEKRIDAAFEMWIWRRMERVKWTDRIRNEVVLERVGEEKTMLKLIRKRKRNLLNHWLRRNCLLKDALEGMVNRRRFRGRRRYQKIDDIMIYGSYAETKRKAENRKDGKMLCLQ
ncbi:hypothetical protein ANN_05950 [Periplaneta americana]|uniref:Reverse transcriptase domain-containing protein n=1 Tax=Periplaneta americana TaxID=6978 RepID=A0ABQ8TC79_PERAM|nr:hypothetical protein ANN_05950 [Periplaneta americana]